MLWDENRPYGTKNGCFLCVLLKKMQFSKNHSLFWKGVFETIIFCGKRNYDILVYIEKEEILVYKGGA